MPYASASPENISRFVPGMHLIPCHKVCWDHIVHAQLPCPCGDMDASLTRRMVAGLVRASFNCPIVAVGVIWAHKGCAQLSGALVSF